MLKHLFKLIWNKKKQNFLLLAEMLVSFMVLFAVFTLMVNYYLNYRKPIGLDDERMVVAKYSPGVDFKTADSLTAFYDNLRHTLKNIPEIQGISLVSNNEPFSPNTRQGGADYGKTHVNHVNMYDADDDFPSVLKVKILEGRWFGRQDNAAIYKPVVINQKLRNELFGSGKAVGERIGSDRKMRVIGVTANVKDKGDYSAPGNGMYFRVDTGNLRSIHKILVKVAPGADAGFESRLYKTMIGAFKNSNIDIYHLSDSRKTINSTTLIPMIILLIVAGFLIINVALGLFGVLWYNINRRRGEIGLRRAIGATGKAVSAQLVAESLILATMALIVGSFFAVQFPLLNVFDLQAGVYLTAILLAAAAIYLLVFICSLYPGKQAASIYPATALHEE